MQSVAGVAPTGMGATRGGSASSSISSCSAAAAASPAALRLAERLRGAGAAPASSVPAPEGARGRWMAFALGFFTSRSRTVEGGEGGRWRRECMHCMGC